MNAWQDGMSVLANEWPLFVVILIFVFVGQALIVSALHNIANHNLTFAENLSLGLAGWTAPVFLMALIGYFAGRIGLTLTLSIVLVLLVISRLKSTPQPASTSTRLIFAPIVFLSIILRLTYVSKLSFPPYFDSATHYLITKNIMAGNLTWLSTNYYHPGFHFITAFFASVFSFEITKVMLILGQVTLALIPFSIFFSVRHETASNMAGWFAVILASFGWYMPAHAVDWGKYPALMSLGLVSFVVSVAHLLSKHKKEFSARQKWALYALGAVGVLVSTLVHSRSIIIFGIVFIAWTTSTRWRRLPRYLANILFALLLVISIMQIILIRRNEVLTLLVDPYLNAGIRMTVLVLLLSIFAYKTYPKLTFASALIMSLLFASLFISVKGTLPAYENLTLLDRPYVEMILFLPLSLLGGLGVAGLEKELVRFAWGRYVALVAIGLVLVNAFFTYDLYPSDCCVIVGNDDVVAMDWMEEQVPVDARIGISSTELRVVASNVSFGLMGSDAGIWITPLTGRTTIPLPYHFEFDQHAIWEQLCQLKISHLYVGEIGGSFDAAKIISRPEWYRPLLSMPKTGVYEVVGCN